ncbi:MAG TPA: paraquat-inducible protein A [Steroidobacteraceae bacterium]
MEKTSGRSLGAALACSLATFLLLFPANILPLLRMDVFGMHSSNVIAAGIIQLWERGWIALAGLSAIMIIALPFLRFGLLSAVLAALRFDQHPRWLGPAFRWSVLLDPFAMLDVFLLAACVGYYRLSNVGQAQISIQLGGACFIAAAILTMLSRATLDRRTVWRAIGGELEVNSDDAEVIGCTVCDLVQPVDAAGGPCPRCGAKLAVRKAHAVMRTAALLATAFILFFPANIYPMNIANQLGRQLGYTVFTGISELFQAGLWPLGALVFCTSILIPAVKIFALGWCVVSVWLHSDRHLIAKTEIFRIVAESGRWSKTDPFVIVFFVPLMNFGPLGSSAAGWGATAFMLMTFITMIASVTFDPRLMWDAARARSP